MPIGCRYTRYLLFIPSHCIHIISSGSKVTIPVFILSPHIGERSSGCSFLSESHNLRHAIFSWDNQHTNMVWASSGLYDFYFLLLIQFSQYHPPHLTLSVHMSSFFCTLVQILCDIDISCLYNLNYLCLCLSRRRPPCYCSCVGGNRFYLTWELFILLLFPFALNYSLPPV